MIEFKIVQAEVEWHSGWGDYTQVKSVEKVMAEMIEEGWQLHTIDLSLDYPKALMEREVNED